MGIPPTRVQPRWKQTGRVQPSPVALIHVRRGANPPRRVAYSYVVKEQISKKWWAYLLCPLCSLSVLLVSLRRAFEVALSGGKGNWAPGWFEMAGFGRRKTGGCDAPQPDPNYHLTPWPSINPANPYHTLGLIKEQSQTKIEWNSQYHKKTLIPALLREVHLVLPQTTLQ